MDETEVITNSNTDKADNSFTRSDFEQLKCHSMGYWNWPPSKWRKSKNEDMAKEGKSPMEIWHIHSNDILENHKLSKQYHENVVTDYEKAKANGETMEFWEKYWKTTYHAKLPNPNEMEERWNAWVKNGNSETKFWDDERKRFKKENKQSFWTNRNKVYCHQGYKNNADKSEQLCLKQKIVNFLLQEEKELFGMFDF